MGVDCKGFCVEAAVVGKPNEEKGLGVPPAKDTGAGLGVGEATGAVRVDCKPKPVPPPKADGLNPDPPPRALGLNPTPPNVEGPPIPEPIGALAPRPNPEESGPRELRKLKAPIPLL